MILYAYSIEEIKNIIGITPCYAGITDEAIIDCYSEINDSFTNWSPFQPTPYISLSGRVNN